MALARDWGESVSDDDGVLDEFDDRRTCFVYLSDEGKTKDTFLQSSFHLEGDFIVEKLELVRSIIDCCMMKRQTPATFTT